MSLKKSLSGCPDGDRTFIVEKIVDHRKKKNGKVEYLVKWESYPHSENSWEPESSFMCKGLLRKYHRGQEGMLGSEPPSQKKRNQNSDKLALAVKGKLDNTGGSAVVVMLDLPESDVSEIVTVLKLYGELMAIVRFDGTNGLGMVRTELLKTKYPQQVIAFYEKLIQWKHK